MKKNDLVVGFALCLAMVCSRSAFAARTGCVPDSSGFYSEDYVRMDDHVYQKYIQGVAVGRVGFDLGDPIVTLGSTEALQVVFDDLQGSAKQYFYKVQHCTAGWMKSEIWPNEYMDGAEEGQVEKFEASFNTRTPYTHYEFQFPNERFIVKKSGNYILRVYCLDPNGKEVNAFTRKVLVVDPKVTVSAKINRGGTADDYETKQEVNFVLNTKGVKIEAPYQDIKVVVLQNWRWDNALATLKPNMVQNGVLDYTFSNGINLFDGVNEFRHFDLKNIRSVSDRVREISFDDTMFYARLWDSDRRTFKGYLTDADLNGKFLLKTDDGPTVGTWGEYVTVKFFLPWEAPIVEGNLYVAGGFNCWQYSPENKMRYSFRRKGYEANIVFKQGYYNYLYVLLPNNSMVGDATWVEGNHSETNNNYTILVYHHQRGELYDELIGTGSFENGK